MTPLRQRMIEDLQLRGYSHGTQKLYVSAVRQLCEHCGKTPGKITCSKSPNTLISGLNAGCAQPDRSYSMLYDLSG